MGFGLLFFGYFAAFLMSLNAYGFVFAMIGYYVIFVALQRISEYKHSILRCIPPLAVMFLCSAAEAVNAALGTAQLASPFDSEMATVILSSLTLVSSLTFHVFLFLSLMALGKDTDLIDVVSSAKTNIAFIALFFTANLTVMFFSNQYVMMVAVILRILFPLFALALIYKCFHKICAPDDVDMPIKPSRFKFVNDMRAKQEQKAEETRIAREELLRKKKETEHQTQSKKKSKKKK